MLRQGCGVCQSLGRSARPIRWPSRGPLARRLAVAPLEPPPPTTPKVKVSAAEMRLHVQFRQRGHSYQDAVDLVRAQRDLAGRLGTPASETVRQSVTDRNASGRWPE